MGGYRTSLAVYDSTADVIAPDGATVKSYRLHSTPFLDTAMTVAGAAVSDGRAALPPAAFDGLSASDLKVSGSPDLKGVKAEPSVTANADGTKTARILFVRNDVVIWRLEATVSAEASKYSADDLKGTAFTVDGKPWGGNDLADPSALTWSGLPDGWTVADSTKDGIRTLAFTAPDGTVVRTVRVGTPHDADKPKTDGTTDKASDTVASNRSPRRVWVQWAPWHYSPRSFWRPAPDWRSPHTDAIKETERKTRGADSIWIRALVLRSVSSYSPASCRARASSAASVSSRYHSLQNESPRLTSSSATPGRPVWSRSYAHSSFRLLVPRAFGTEPMRVRPGARRGAIRVDLAIPRGRLVGCRLG